MYRSRPALRTQAVKAYGFNPKRFFIISSIVPLLIGRSLLPDIFIGAIWLGPDAGIVFEGGSDAGCGVVFDAGCGVVFEAGCGVGYLKLVVELYLMLVVELYLMLVVELYLMRCGVVLNWLWSCI